MTRFLLVILFVIVSVEASSRDLRSPPLTLSGAKVSSEDQARRIASDAYTVKMKGELLATEGIAEIELVSLGYEVDGFAESGAVVWQLTFRTIEGEFRGVVWVHPETRLVCFVNGPWMSSALEVI